MQSMTARERMLAAINHQPVDRVPTDIWATAEVWAKLKAHFGEGTNFFEMLHIDGFAGTGAAYIGPAQPPAPQDQTVDFWGIRRGKIGYGSGHYDEVCFNPLAAATTLDDLEAYAWPQADWFDYSQMKAAAATRHATHAVACGYMAIFYHHNLLRGLETSLMDPLLEPDFTHHLLGRLSDFFFEHHKRMFQACEGLIDLTQVTDDYGSQHGPIISLEVFNEFYRPHMKRFVDLAHGFGVKTLHHDDGAIRPFIPHLIDIGIDILNPIQWRCPGMAIEGLKADFGQKLCFHGGVDNQYTLPFATAADVRAEVRRNIDVLASDGTGYILAPCHNIQANTPVENIVALYDEAWQYGKRS